jgi:UDP-N-acetylglucosamine--dolichyl-phosphate N-acetylglucosaminephosphotransferase
MDTRDRVAGEDKRTAGKAQKNEYDMNVYDVVMVVVGCVISFGVTFFLMPSWIRYAGKLKITGQDMHKVDKREIPEAGGLVVMCAIVLALMFYAAVQVFLNKNQEAMMFVIGSVGSILLVAIIGVMDDFRGWKVGLKQWQKPLMTLPAAIPFLLVNFNRTTIDIPFIGIQDIGILVPLVLVTIAVVGASNAFNMLAGYNGLESGMGIIILVTFGILSILEMQTTGIIFCFVGVCALAGFLVYNWYPSRVFPGDTMTYPIGAFIAVCAMLGRVEKYALILFIPYFLDFILPLRKGMKVEAFAKVNDDGSFEPPYQAVYDTTHIAIRVLKKLKKKVYEKDVVLLILGFELLLAVSCILLYLFVPQY